MGRHLKHCKRGSGKGQKRENNNCTHALPVQGNNPTEPVLKKHRTDLAPEERHNTHPRKPEHQLRRKGNKLSKQITRLEQEAARLHTTCPANTAIDAVAGCSTFTCVEQHPAADSAASYPVDLESSTSEDLPDFGEEGAEFSTGGSPAAEDPCQ